MLNPSRCLRYVDCYYYYHYYYYYDYYCYYYYYYRYMEPQGLKS